MELGFECNGWVENSRIGRSAGVFLFYWGLLSESVLILS